MGIGVTEVLPDHLPLRFEGTEEEYLCYNHTVFCCMRTSF